MSDQPITVTVKEFCRLSGLCRDKVFELVKDGTIDSFMCGKLRLISVDSYRRWVAEQVILDRASPRPAMNNIAVHKGGSVNNARYMNRAVNTAGETMNTLEARKAYRREWMRRKRENSRTPGSKGG